MIKIDKKFRQDVSSREKALMVASWLDEKQGGDIRGIDVAGLTSVCDYVLVVTARSTRHAQGLADHVLDMLGKENLEYLGMEGFKSGEWILLDLNDVVVHVFQESDRGYYNLEGLWSEAKDLDLDLERHED